MNVTVAERRNFWISFFPFIFIYLRKNVISSKRRTSMVFRHSFFLSFLLRSIRWFFLFVFVFDKKNQVYFCRLAVAVGAQNNSTDFIGEIKQSANKINIITYINIIWNNNENKQKFSRSQYIYKNMNSNQQLTTKQNNERNKKKIIEKWMFFEKQSIDTYIIHNLFFRFARWHNHCCISISRKIKPIPFFHARIYR